MTYLPEAWLIVVSALQRAGDEVAAPHAFSLSYSDVSTGHTMGLTSNTFELGRRD